GVAGGAAPGGPGLRFSAVALGDAGGLDGRREGEREGQIRQIGVSRAGPASRPVTAACAGAGAERSAGISTRPATPTAAASRTPAAARRRVPGATRGDPELSSKTP